MAKNKQTKLSKAQEDVTSAEIDRLLFTRAQSASGQTNKSADDEIDGQTRLSQVASECGLPITYTSEIIDRIATNILMELRNKWKLKEARQASGLENADGAAKGAAKRKKPSKSKTLSGMTPAERDDVFEKAYKKLNGDKGLYSPDGLKIPPDFLLGPAGHGKTSVMRVASKKVADLVGLTWRDNPSEEIEITEDDYVFASLEFAGANSPIQIKGMPTKKVDPDTKEEFLSFLQNYMLSTLNDAGGATLLLDDLRNAYQSIISVAMPLLDESRYAGTHLKGVYIGATGNLGAMDSTKVADMSAAMRTRVNMLMVIDNAAEAADRLEKKFSGIDEIGNAYIVPFIRRHGKEMFDELPNPGELGCYPVPRLLERAIVNQRNNIKRAGGMKNSMAASEEWFSQSVRSLLGREYGTELGKFIMYAYSKVDPIARKLIMDGDFDENDVSKYLDNPNSPESMDFFYQWSNGLVNWSTVRIGECLVPDPDNDKKKVIDWDKFDETVNRFFDGVFEMDSGSQAITPAIEGLRENLANTKEFSFDIGWDDDASDSSMRIVSKEAFEHILNAALENPKTDEHYMSVIGPYLANTSENNDMWDVGQESAPRKRGV